MCGRLFALGYVAGPAGVVAMAIADKKGRTGQPLSEEGVDDRAYRKHENDVAAFAVVQRLSSKAQDDLTGHILICS